ARLHHAPRRRGGVAARGAGATGRAGAADRYADGPSRERLESTGSYRSIPGRTSQARLDGRPQHADRHSPALLQQTRSIPIVFAIVGDPIGSGFVASFARPGGNVTGFNVSEPTQSGKWVELLKEVVPRVARIAILFNPASA